MKPIDPRLLRHARHSRGGIALLAVIGSGQAVTTLAVAVALALFVAGSGSVPFLADSWAVPLLAAAFVVRAALAWAEQVVAHRTAARVGDELRRSLVRAVARRGPAWVAGFGSGRLTALLTSGLDSLRPWFAGYLPAVILGGVLPPLVLLAIFLVDPASALIALATLPLIPLLGALIGWATQAGAQRRWQADARLAGHFLDVVRGLATLRTFGRATRQTEVIADLTDRHRRATLRVLRVAFLSSTALDLIGTLSVGLIAVSTGLRVAAGHLPLGPALLIILLAPEVYRPLREMAARYHAATDATAVIADVDEVLTDLPPALPTGDRVGLAAAGLRVRYPGAVQDALALPELVVGAGELVALTGPSGAGKTTALRALAGLQPLDAGTVALDGTPLYVPQSPSLPHARVVADLFPAGTPVAEIAAALAAVGLAGNSRDGIASTTALGEHGAGVSAGQRHRLALAAALFHGPATLLLDEPTAHLDPETEQLVIARLHEAAAAGSAILVAAHRPALIATADRITEITPPADPSAGGPPQAPVALLQHASPTPTQHRVGVSQPARSDTSSPSSTPDPTPVDKPQHPTASPTQHRVGATKPAGSDTSSPSSTPDPTPVNAPQHPTASPAQHRVGASQAPTSDKISSLSTGGGAHRRGWGRWLRPWVAVALGSGSSLAGLVLTGAAAWLLVRAASLPPVLTLSAAVVLVRGSAVARPLLRYVERLVAHDVAFARLGGRRARVYAALIPRVPGARLRRRGDLLTKVVDDVDAQVDGLLRGLLPAWAAWVTLGVGATVAILIVPGLVVPVGAGLVVAGIVAPVFGRRQAARQEAASAEARADLRDAMVETVDGIEELRGSGLLRVPDRRSRRLAAREAQAARSAGGAGALAHLGWGVAVAGAALVLGRAGLSHEWTAVLLLGLVVLGDSALGLPDAAVARMRAAGARDRLAGLMAEPPSATFPGDETGAIPADGTGATGRIEIKGLVAGWGEQPALRGLDLTLAPGDRVAINGRSGAGKSTLGMVLARLLDARGGTITIGGHDIRRLSEDAIRGHIVLVGDDTGHVFASTVRENLRLAKPAAGDEELRRVLERVRLTDWLNGTPDGLDTWLGTGGSTISGGQARRLATARALLADPGLLILDEPTEGLDEPTARALMSDLLGAADGRTVLVLTHRDVGLDVLTLRDGQLSGGTRAGSR